jgi:predicted O-methyltransferase YrrM
MTFAAEAQEGVRRGARRAAVRAHRLYNRIRHGMATRYERLYQLVEAHQPATLLEIGVWNGWHARGMLARRRDPRAIEYYGFDLFEHADPGRIEREIGKAPPTRDAVRARLAEVVSPEQVHLVAGDTTETLPAIVESLPPMDFVFVDGGHSLETVRSDWRCVERLLHPASVVVFDDYVNDAAVAAEGWGTNAVIDAIDRGRYDVELVPPTDWWEKPWGILQNRLAVVRPRVAAFGTQVAGAGEPRAAAQRASAAR